MDDGALRRHPRDETRPKNCRLEYHRCKVHLDLTTGSDREKAKRAFAAMMTMGKIDIATVEAAAKVKRPGR
jgi:hypothetical protein